MTEEEFRAHFRGVVPGPNNSWTAFCPAHDDGAKHGHRSLSGDVMGNRRLINCLGATHCRPEDILAAVGLQMKDLFLDAATGTNGASPRPQETRGGRGRPGLASVGGRSGKAIADKQRANWWDAAVPIAGTLAESYLRGRGIDVDFSALHTLKFLARAPYYAAGQKKPKAYYPCMVGGVGDLDGHIVGVHRTYLAIDGKEKAPEEEPKKMLGQMLPWGVRLSARNGLIRVGEGIESILSVATDKGGLKEAQYAAATSAICLAKWQGPEHERLEIYGDNDEAGHKAANELSLSEKLAGKQVWIFMPKAAGQDFNDTLRSGGSGAVSDVSGQEAAEPTPEQVRAANRPVLAAQAPGPIADAYIQAATTPDGRIIHFWDERWWYWKDGRYRERNKQEQRGLLADFIRTGVRLIDDKGRTVEPTSWHLSNAFDFLQAGCMLHDIQPPTWLDGRTVAGTLVAVRNGILNLITKELLSPSPQWFTDHALEVVYEPTATAPQWCEFLASLWDDEESHLTLQEIFGYLLTLDTSYQKAFMIVGPERSGKGTIARIITTIIGEQWVASPALAAFGREFGIEDLVGKTLATISDARLDIGVSAGLLAENLLRITGEDYITIPRKYLKAWAGKLPVRFLLLTNELPHFRDPSGALPHRFIVLRTLKSFRHVEDLTLERRLKSELPGILNWSIEGLIRLRERGRFVQPKVGVEAADHLAEIANPLASFVDEACVLGSNCEILFSGLYKNYVEWCKSKGIKPSYDSIFSRDLRAFQPQLSFQKPHDAPRVVKGIKTK
jgi:putative DNA primase/helicase